ncbi:conserved hypothetical protein [Bacillus subtilis subsp. subtilis str. RO-NN-1]|uniref:DUF3885 domain-containing protein n=1 Tax=Bacillus subtilis TaxID=1423 RepID=UPI00022BB97F|nr:DUF3885 domain-containing protein [Bacillus subtilis]AEP90918.1 conserved hypothetical protein [Bacillus subtilis subsp. subtilis str. RO-NN-1]UVZ59727.1 DUF3885 domain-containing protein [Bacillus subtilis]
MNLIGYMEERFQNLELIPSIYNQWGIGIHFCLGENIYQFKENEELNLKRFQVEYEQITIIFKELFEQNDDIFLVTNMYKHKKEKCIRKLKVYQPFLKCKNHLNQILVKTYPYPFEIDKAGEYEMQQFSLLCKPRDLRVTEILKAASNEDFPLKPTFGGYSIDYPDVFFVNITKDIIFFIYDDRGCEVIALNFKRIRHLYEKYHDWVEEYKCM